MAQFSTSSDPLADSDPAGLSREIKKRCQEEQDRVLVSGKTYRRQKNFWKWLIPAFRDRDLAELSWLGDVSNHHGRSLVAQDNYYKALDKLYPGVAELGRIKRLAFNKHRPLAEYDDHENQADTLCDYLDDTRTQVAIVLKKMTDRLPIHLFEEERHIILEAWEHKHQIAKVSQEGLWHLTKIMDTIHKGHRSYMLMEELENELREFLKGRPANDFMYTKLLTSFTDVAEVERNSILWQIRRIYLAETGQTQKDGDTPGAPEVDDKQFAAFVKEIDTWRDEINKPDGGASADDKQYLLDKWKEFPCFAALWSFENQPDRSRTLLKESLDVCWALAFLMCKRRKQAYFPNAAIDDFVKQAGAFAKQPIDEGGLKKAHNTTICAYLELTEAWQRALILPFFPKTHPTTLKAPERYVDFYNYQRNTIEATAETEMAFMLLYFMGRSLAPPAGLPLADLYVVHTSLAKVQYHTQSLIKNLKQVFIKFRLDTLRKPEANQYCRLPISIMYELQETIGYLEKNLKRLNKAEERLNVLIKKKSPESGSEKDGVWSKDALEESLRKAKLLYTIGCFDANIGRLNWSKAKLYQAHDRFRWLDWATFEHCERVKGTIRKEAERDNMIQKLHDLQRKCRLEHARAHMALRRVAALRHETDERQRHFTYARGHFDKLMASKGKASLESSLEKYFHEETFFWTIVPISLSLFLQTLMN